MKSGEPPKSGGQTPPDPGGGQPQQQPPQFNVNNMANLLASVAPTQAQFPVEFWTMLAKSTAAATPTPTAAAMAANTNIRLPPAFNLTATIQHLLRTAQQQSGAAVNPAISAAAVHQQNATFLLQQALLGQSFGNGQQMGSQQQHSMVATDEGQGNGVAHALARIQSSETLEQLRDCEKAEVATDNEDVGLLNI
jgi:hypothetical protein